MAKKFKELLIVQMGIRITGSNDEFIREQAENLGESRNDIVNRCITCCRRNQEMFEKHNNKIDANEQKNA